MPKFYITNENTEDRLDSTNNIEDAIRIAREMARNEQAGNLVYIETGGKNIKQFVLLANGKVAEETLV